MTPPEIIGGVRISDNVLARRELVYLDVRSEEKYTPFLMSACEKWGL
jgi:hypothetical protein